MGRYFILTVVFLLAACRPGYQATIDSWMGHSENELVSSWGAPNSFYETTSGERMLTYRRGRSGVGSVPVTSGYNWNPYSTTATVTTYRPVAYNWWCETTFTVRGGTIASATWQGNNCR